MSFHIVQCQPYGLPYTGVLTTICLYPITSRAAEGGTFVQWSGHYTADASEGRFCTIVKENEEA